MQIPTVRFPRDTSAFTRTLRQRVDSYFKENNISRTGDWRMYLKTSVMLALYFVPWALFTFGVTGTGVWFWVAELVMGLGLAGIGLNVMHDANHGAFSKSKMVNDLLGRTLDLVGGNAALWRIQHNVLHHTFTNIDGLDEDIDTPGLLRFTPQRPLKPWHRFQHIYAWFFYAIMSLFWITAKDWIAISRYDKKGLIERSGTTKGKLITYLVITKSLHFFYMFALPLIFSDLAWWQVLVGWVVMHAVAGLALASIFQLAHVMEHHTFPQAVKGEVMEADPMAHQLQTTANFGTRSRLLTWLSGGLNHQIEHHLFPNICHVHHSKLAPIVEKTAREFGLPYNSQTTFWTALRVHTRMLRTLGQTA